VSPPRLPAQSRSLLGEPLIVLGAVALVGTLAPLAPWPCLLLGAVWVLFWARDARFAAACVLVFGLSAVLAEGARDRYRRSWSAHAQLFAGFHRCVVRGAVVSSPVARRALSSVGLDETFVFRSEVGACDGRTIPGGTLLRLTQAGTNGTARGDRFEVIADLGPLRLFRNAPLGDPFASAARHGATLGGRVLAGTPLGRGTGLAALLDRARAHVRARIVATYAPRAVSLGRALVLGESDLEPEEGDAFKKSGLMHLLAVSGTHLVIAVLGLVQGLRALLVRLSPLARRFDVARISAAAGAILSLLYADFAGGSGSAWRAAYMLVLVLCARAVGLRLAGGAALGGSLLIGLGRDPLVGADASFLLSALATAGLIGLGQPIMQRLTSAPLARFPLQAVVSSLVATWSATVTCSPLLAVMDGRMTLSALFANIVAGPVGELLALPACLLHALTSIVPALERGLAFVGSGALLGVRAVALWSARQEALSFVLPRPDAWGCAAVAAGFVFWPSLERSLRGLGAHRSAAAWAARLSVLLVSGLLLVLGGPGSGHVPLGRLAITALDVDQGDALVVDFPDGRLGLVDGGGFATGVPDTGQRVLLPYLRARGRRAVDLMILSHAHPDHLLGLATVAESLPVRELWLLEAKSRGPDVRRLIDAVRRGGGRVRGAAELCASADGALEFGGATVSVLVPCDAETAWSELGENDRSLVVHLKYGLCSALLTGDIEHEGERRLLGLAADRVRADLLKVPHHGSDTSSGAELLAAVRPKAALISAGVRNRFDHPRPSVLERLERARIGIWRTDRAGSISWLTDGERTWLRGFSPMVPAPARSGPRLLAPRHWPEHRPNW